MKITLLFAVLFSTIVVSGQTIQSDVYSWKNLSVEKQGFGESRPIVKGPGAVNANIEISAMTLAPGKEPHGSHKHAEEELVIVKEGILTMTINGKTQQLKAGGVAYVMPDDEHHMVNKSKANTTLYLLKYRAKTDADSLVIKMERDGESIMINWDDIAIKPHDKGTRRDFFEKPTPLFRRFEMHVTTLNPGFKSHDPHTHKAEEIVLLIYGEGEMQLGTELKKTEAGDVIFLGSNVLHAIRNTGTKPLSYFAFQWD
jgi:(S)-ureidoglycine aminohydrolase